MDLEHFGLIQTIKKTLEKRQLLFHWLSFETLKKKTKTSTRYQKLKIKKSFSSKDEITIIRIFLQKIYLVSLSEDIKVPLFVSKQFYENKNGLIYGIYHFQVSNDSLKKYSSVEMIKVSQIYKKNVFQECLGKMITFLSRDCGKHTQENQNSEYQVSLRNLFEKENNQNLFPFQFIDLLEKQPLCEHYLYKLRFKNAMLMPIFYSNHELNESYLKRRQKEKQIYEQLRNLQQNKLRKSQLEFLHQQMQQMMNEIYQHNKIGWINGKKKKKSKFSYQFVIILSHYRSMQEKIQKIEEKFPLQNTEQISQPQTKIQIRAFQGKIKPRSGNAIFVNLQWATSEKNNKIQYILKINCYNNHKVQLMYFDEVEQFWNELAADQQFQNITKLNKYFLSREETKQISLTRIVYDCLLTDIFQELDQTIAVLLAIDEVVELAEKKGEQCEQNSFQVKAYHLEQAKTLLRAFL